MSSMTGTGSSVSALYSRQHKTAGGSIVEDNPFFSGVVPEGLLRDCDKKRKETLVSTVRKATNLYRRVSTVSYVGSRVVGDNKRPKPAGAECFVCLVALVKSSRDGQRAGVKLRCRCNVRVCATCFANDPKWFLTEPHYTKCPIVQGFVCAVCSCFHGVKEKVCCLWMCSRCSSERRTRGRPCAKCGGDPDRRVRRDTRTLWCETNGLSGGIGPGAEPCGEPGGAYDEEKVADYRDLIRSRVFDRVSQSRHLSASHIRTLFRECFAPQVCTCASEDERNAMCASCTPVLTVMQLLARNPRPLAASFAERAIPGRALARNTYDRALLIGMLNDRDLPFCVNGSSCKGLLLEARDNPGPLRSLISPESYRGLASTRAKAGEARPIGPCHCILCLLFNQSAAVAQMCSPDEIRLEPHPSGPVYYFNVKLAADVGVPEVYIDEHQGYLVSFEGSVGSYKPTFYYNWRDMLKVLHRDNSGTTISFLPSQ